MVAPAFALPGDQAVQSQHPFRLADNTLEPGCFVPGRYAPVEVDSHLDLTYLMDHKLAREVHITVDANAPFSVDQVLVPSAIDGYSVTNTFDTGSVADDADVDPTQTAVDLFAPDSNGIDGPDPISKGDVVVCVSDHGAPQNEPYQSEAGGMVSAKNRPIIAPQISALGVSAISNLDTYKVGFGYSVERWYVAPTYDGAGTFPFHPLVTDPNASPTNVFTGLPATVRMNPREDGDYDARRVNDVDSYAEEFSGQKDNYGQVRVFKADGDLTAWSESGNNVPDTLGHLITFTAQGDLPYTWTLRPSLGAPNTERSVTINDAYLDSWRASWQAWCDFAGPKPTLPLAPGTSAPCKRGSAPAPTPPAATPPAAAAPVNTVTNTTQVVQAPAAPAATAPKATAKKKATAKQKRAYKRCMTAASKKKGSAKAAAKAKCAKKLAR